MKEKVREEKNGREGECEGKRTPEAKVTINRRTMVRKRRRRKKVRKKGLTGELVKGLR